MRLPRIAASVGICALACAVGATPALAARGDGGSHARHVTAVTRTAHHPDTSTTAGPCTVASDGGPIWAYDDLRFRFDVVQTGTDTYTVTINAGGVYHAFASRFTGACTTQSGPMAGWVNYSVTSMTGPIPADLPPSETGTVPQATMLDQLFGTTATITGSGGYSYTYRITQQRCTTSTTGFSCS